MRITLLVALALAGCSTTNPNFCPGAPDNNCKLVDAGPDALKPCDNNDDCTGDTKVCKLPAGACVECVASTDCTTATEPICDPAMNACVGCRSHADCPASGACLPDGSCADPLQVAYASSTGSGTACTLATPCKTLGEALATAKPVVKLLGPGIIEGTGDTMIDRKVTIVTDAGTVLDRTNDGPILKIGSGGDVSISDLQISGAGGPMGDGIQVQAGGKLRLERVAVHTNAKVGLVATSAEVRILRSVFSSNVGGGAILTLSHFEITNSLFVANGSGSSDVGGLQLQPSTNNYVFSFNTVADNQSKATQPINGVVCVSVVNLSNNIISRNTTTPNCIFDHTLFDTGTVVIGTNVAGEPVFRNRDVAMPTSPTYYRIGPTSDAKDRADPAAPIATDIDGDARPQGNGKDMGADEAKP